MRLVQFAVLSFVFALLADPVFAGGRRGGCGHVRSGQSQCGQVQGGCLASTGQAPTFTAVNPAVGYPVRYVTPGCSGGACSPAGVPAAYGFQIGQTPQAR